MGDSNFSFHLWEVWPGDGVTCCGRFVCAPTAAVFTLNVILLVGGSVAFILYVALPVHVALAVFSSVLGVVVLCSLAWTTTTDAGVLPRGRRLSDTALSFAETHAPVIDFNGSALQLKLCSTCGIIRPPRSSHCRDCDVCVEEFDHHCPWVNNCVGKRNHRFFVMYITSLLVYSFFIFIVSLIVFTRSCLSSADVAGAIEDSPAALALCIFALCTSCCMAAMTVERVSLVAREITKKELVVKQRRESAMRHDAQIESRHVSDSSFRHYPLNCSSMCSGISAVLKNPGPGPLDLSALATIRGELAIQPSHYIRNLPLVFAPASLSHASVGRDTQAVFLSQEEVSAFLDTFDSELMGEMLMP